MYLSATALAAAVSAAAATSSSPLVSRAPEGFEPGVSWQICIHQPIKHDSAADFVPEDAQVFNVDMGHAVDYPQMIPRLHVRLSLYWSYHTKYLGTI